MTGHHKFSQLTAQFSEARKAKIAVKTERLKEEMEQWQLTQFLEKYQKEIANDLDLHPSEVAQLEQNTQVYLTSLRQAIKKLGGELSITVRLSDEEIKIQ